MYNLPLMEKIFTISNSTIFHLDVLPWKEDNLIENIITALKRRIDVTGFQSIIKYDDLDPAERAETDLLLKDGIIISIGESKYLIITELGMIYLNNIYSGVSEDILNISRKMLAKAISINLQKRCESVFANQISNKEAVFGLFLILNGAVDKRNKFKLIPSEIGGYLYGDYIINEINCIYSTLINDEEQILIKDHKEFRNIIGRIGKNGRFARVFPQHYNRDSDSIWFDFSSSENVLLVYKSTIKTLVETLFARSQGEAIIQNLIKIIEKYMINNPLEPYVINEIFNNSNNFDSLYKMHTATKNLLRKF